MSKQKRIAPIAKNDDITLEITALSSDGQGIGRYEGFAVFVPYALPGEEADVHIIKVSSNYAVAKINGIINPCAARTEPVCECFYRCGGCDLQHMTYAEQLTFKRTRVRDALVKMADMSSEAVEGLLGNTLGMQNPWRYRNKASIPFGNTDGKVCGGFFAPRSHRLIAVSDCPIQNETSMQAMRAVCDWANKYGIPAYNEETGTGVLRHIVTRASASGDLLVTIVTTGELHRADELVRTLRGSILTLVGIVHNINSRDTNIILGETFTTLWGDNAITEEISGATFSVACQSFMQVNHEQTEKLYSLAVDKLELAGNETVLDIYCGIGTITLLLAKKAKRVIGIESVKEAVSDARANAKANGLDNAEFIVGEAEQVMFLPEVEKLAPDAIVIDPPRKGCDEAVLRAIIKTQAKRLVYVSCNPETLARDIKILANGGFSLVSAQPVDMFPQSAHVETVVLMSMEK